MKIELFMNELDAIFTFCRVKKIKCNFFNNSLDISEEYNFKQYDAKQLSYSFGNDGFYHITWNYENRFKIKILSDLPGLFNNETILKVELTKQMQFYKDTNAKIQDFIAELYT